jgi:hypothetical protein
VLNVDGTTSKSGEKIDLSVVEEIILLTLEPGMGLLLNFEDHISR